jgi:hypothetical protein
MKNDNKDLNIKSDLKSPQMMIDYLKGNFGELLNHETEEALMKDQFTADALEGLYGKLNDQELNKVQNKLNSFINHKINNQKNKANKNLAFPIWIILLLVVLLLISISGYVLVRFMLK